MLLPHGGQINDDTVSEEHGIQLQILGILTKVYYTKDGRVAADGKTRLEELLKLDPKDIDLLLQGQHEDTVVAETLEDEDNYGNDNMMVDDPLANFYLGFDLDFLFSIKHL